VSNDGWFNHSAELEQHLSASVFRAVEYRMPIARAVNTGISLFIDSVGRSSDRVGLSPSQIARLDGVEAALRQLHSVVSSLASHASTSSPRGPGLPQRDLEQAIAILRGPLADAIAALPE